MLGNSYGSILSVSEVAGLAALAAEVFSKRQSQRCALFVTHLPNHTAANSGLI